MAAIPAFLLTMVSIGWSFLRYAGVLPALDGFSLVNSHARACASAYGLTVYSSEHYISADAPRPGPGEVQQRELATVVSGMVENKCAENLGEVRILLHVHDSAGKLRAAWATVHNLAPNQSKPFERAMIGQFSSPEVIEIR